ncbi:MAG: ATP-binding protein, partial [Acidobacteria bacterium]|nr:ATP-binding protein [Acidobacteriota bacterium]
MGKAIYENPLVALRELLQNAVDACKLRDSLMPIFDQDVEPKRDNRITVEYQSEPDAQINGTGPILIITDTGIGMDRSIIEQFFLKIGKSFYRSNEFNRIRLKLREANSEFAPVSEFGIGFLSCFLLCDQIIVETASCNSSLSKDIRKRTLRIDGPTRLIRIEESP